MRKGCILPGGDAVPGGAAVEVLPGSFEDGAVSSDLVEDHTGVDGSCADGRVLQANSSQSAHRYSVTQYLNITVIFNQKYIT